MTTCAPLWPTPVGSVAQLGEGPATWLARRERVKAKGINGNGMGLPLTMAVQMDPMDWTDGKCPCRCHLSMSSAEASPAKISPTPAEAQDSTGTARVFGVSTPDSFATFDPATSSWKTSQLSLLEEWAEFSQTWPRAGMTRSGTAYPLRPLAPLTDGTGSGLLPTPDTGTSPNGHGRRGGKAGNGRQSGASLDAMAKHGTWPTPHGICAPGPRRPGPSGNELGRAVNEAERQWPTPKASDGSRDSGQATRWGPGNSQRSNLKDALRYRQTEAGEPTTGSLNPTWVEWLMGFPPGWTDLGPSATPSCRRSLNGSDDASSSTSSEPKGAA